MTNPNIILQAGHGGRTSGITGAPNEQSFNVDISNSVASELRGKGFTVKVVNADPTPEEIKGDYNLFLAIHYDSDSYNSGGFFVDFPEPSTDDATLESQRLAGALRDVYGATTGIVNHPERSNKNTRFYYMWKSISAKTPCVLIECGVGMHVPDDHQILHFNRPLVVKGIVNGILKGFNIADNQDEITNLKKQIVDLQISHDTLSKRVEELEATVNLNEEVIATSTQEVVALKAQIQKDQEDLDYYKPYKSRYESALQNTIDKFSAGQLISLGMRKLWETRKLLIKK